LSRDVEDVVAVLDGRPEIVDEVREADAELKIYLRKRFWELLKNQSFIDALPGHLPPDAASQARARLILERLQELSEIK
jgi:hypothetical protein